jgi:hypothetical protein
MNVALKTMLPHCSGMSNDNRMRRNILSALENLLHSKVGARVPMTPLERVKNSLTMLP